MANDIDKDIEELEEQQRKYQKTGFFGALGEAAKKVYVDPIAAKLKALVGQEQSPTAVQPDPRLAAIQQIKHSYTPQEADDVIAKAQALRAAKETQLGGLNDQPAPKEPTDEQKAAAEMRRFAQTLQMLK